MTFTDMKDGKNIAIFCSALDVADIYGAEVEEFVRLMVSHGYDLVWGGSEMGLMKRVADAARDSGGKLHGVSVEFLQKVARKNADSMVIAKTLGERKDIMLSLSQALVVMPGGVGTLDEAFQVIELKKQHKHEKPIVILNILGYYDGLQTQFDMIEHEGFLNVPVDELVHFAPDAADAIAYIDRYLAKG